MEWLPMADEQNPGPEEAMSCERIFSLSEIFRSALAVTRARCGLQRNARALSAN